MSTSRRLTLALTLLAAAACGDATSPDASTRPVPSTPSRLLGVNEYGRMIVDTSDAAGNHTMVAEYPAGVYTLPNGDGASVGSVTIRTFIPGSGNGSSKFCITSTIDRVETTPGWTASVKKAGGCDKEIGVQLENKSTKQRADFSFLYVAGKTRIDYGAVR